MKRIEPGPGQESVWDYPRPPRLEKSGRHIQVAFGGIEIADARAALRVLETSHPPVYYLPFRDVRMEFFEQAGGGSYCEWKGGAEYFTIAVADRKAEKAAWHYPRPTRAFAELKDHLAIYAGPMDACLIDGQRVQPQPGGFYGGWITSDVVGPFKGGPGTRGW